MQTKIPVTSQRLDELEAVFAKIGQPDYRARQLTQWLYQKRLKSFPEMTDLPAALRQQLADTFAFGELRPVRVLGSRDTTRKFLFQLADGSLVESVLIPASPLSTAKNRIAGRSVFPRR